MTHTHTGRVYQFYAQSNERRRKKNVSTLHHFIQRYTEHLLISITVKRCRRFTIHHFGRQRNIQIPIKMKTIISNNGTYIVSKQQKRRRRRTKIDSSHLLIESNSYKHIFLTLTSTDSHFRSHRIHMVMNTPNITESTHEIHTLMSRHHHQQHHTPQLYTPRIQKSILCLMMECIQIKVVGFSNKHRKFIHISYEWGSRFSSSSSSSRFIGWQIYEIIW